VPETVIAYLCVVKEVEPDQPVQTGQVLKAIGCDRSSDQLEMLEIGKRAQVPE
jgi:hypothetical protein